MQPIAVRVCCFGAQGAYSFAETLDLVGGVFVERPRRTAAGAIQRGVSQSLNDCLRW